jgi:hypothetical protein
MCVYHLLVTTLVVVVFLEIGQLARRSLDATTRACVRRGVEPPPACHLPWWLCHWATAQFASHTLVVV